MVVLVGIDEAGFGPILGPLVVSSSTFSLPHNLLTCDLWRILRKSVSGRRKHLAGRLLIADSKKAYTRSSGIGHLQRTVLTVLKCLNKEPSTLTELIELLCPSCLGRLSGYPWYRNIADCGLSMDIADKQVASAVLADDLAANGIELLDLKSFCMDVEYYNKMAEAVKNKANVLFSATCSLIKSAYDKFAGDDLQIIVDRQGGRVHYRKSLQRMFSDMKLKILRESPATSSYELQAGGGAMRIHFVVGADERYLPVSLASMVSKYVRELLVGNINRYFIGLSAELKPTAGYWKDGLRFIEDVKTNLPGVRFNSNQLIRTR
jgi:ribonuclease HII